MLIIFCLFVAKPHTDTDMRQQSLHYALVEVDTVYLMHPYALLKLSLTMAQMHTAPSEVNSVFFFFFF